MDMKGMEKIEVKVIKNTGDQAVFVATDGDIVTVDREEGTRKEWKKTWPVGSKHTTFRKLTTDTEYEKIRQEAYEERNK